MDRSTWKLTKFCQVSRQVKRHKSKTSNRRWLQSGRLYEQYTRTPLHWHEMHQLIFKASVETACQLFLRILMYFTIRQRCIRILNETVIRRDQGIKVTSLSSIRYLSNVTVQMKLCTVVHTASWILNEQELTSVSHFLRQIQCKSWQVTLSWCQLMPL